MKENTMLQVFALDKTGKVRFVEEVTRGLSCDCICPVCGEAVVAKQGDIRGWHFAHSSDTDCAGAGESALHLAAKQILVEEKGVMVPEVSVNVVHQLPDGREGEATVTRPEMWLDFISVETEMNYGNIRPDVVVYMPDSMMFIEVAVTHYVGEDKSHAIEQLSVPTLEIDVSELLEKRLDWQTLKSLVIDDLHNKKWIQQLGQSAIEVEARELAINDALSKKLTNEPYQPIKPPKYRFVVNGKRLYVTEYPFGLTVWFQYDSEVLAVVKPILTGLGGGYRKLYKNWLLPAEGKEYLLEKLTSISSEEMEAVQ